MTIARELSNIPRVFIRQRRELVELLGFETRNKYSIETEDGRQLGFAAEQQKGILGFPFRQALGHWRRYSINIFNPARELEVVADHPFRFYFQRLDVRTAQGEVLGYLERRFEILTKRFDLFDAQGTLLLTVHSPLWRIWSFKFMRGKEQWAFVSKKWGGLLKEALLDADSFLLEFQHAELTAEHRVVLLAAALFIDLRYFENKGGGAGASIVDAFLPG